MIEEQKYLYVIGIPTAFPESAILSKPKEGVSGVKIGRRKAKDIVFQAILDEHYVSVTKRHPVDGIHTMDVINIAHKDDIMAMAKSMGYPDDNL